MRFIYIIINLKAIKSKFNSYSKYYVDYIRENNDFKLIQNL